MEKFKTYKDYTAEQLFGGTVMETDTETQAFINDHFNFREVCDDDEHFLHYFHRDINRFYPRYLLLVADELTAIPDLIDYKEEIINQKQSNQTVNDVITKVSEKIKSDTEALVKEVIDNDIFGSTSKLTGDETTDETYSADDDVTHSNTKLNTGDKISEQLTDGKKVHVEKGGSNTIKYNGAQAGVIPSLDWDVIGGQSQDSVNEGKSKVTDDLSETQNGADNRDISSTGQEKTTHNTTDTKNGTHNSTLNEDTTRNKDGQENVSESGNKDRAAKIEEGEYKRKQIMSKFETELRTNVWDYIRDHEALGWLLGILEHDFMQVGF